MSVFLLAAVAAAATPSVPDQTRDVVVIAQFLDAVKEGRDTEAFLAKDVFIGDYFQRKNSGLEPFADYARACKLKKVNLVVGASKPMPLGVEWSCRYPDKDRAASFWLNEGKIVRIGWGEVPVVRVAPPKR